MANLPKPDVSFNPNAGFRSGHSKPIFIIKKNNVLYMTKVLWPYHQYLAGPDTDLNSIQRIQDLFDNSSDRRTEAREVLESDVLNITEGFAK